MGSDSLQLITGGALRSALFERAAATRGAPEPLPPGSVVGNYRIVGVLAEGGTSVIYEAERCDGVFQQTVALKVAFASRLLRDYARRERDVLAKLAHPLIAKIHDAGETGDGVLWFAMELVRGQRIDRYVAERQLGWAERIGLIRQIAGALAEAHRRLVIHCDIKPANILVDEQGSPRVLDFGIATDAAAGDANGDRRMLTLAYASPEQIRGEPADVRSDIYQLALLADELLFEGGAGVGRRTPSASLRQTLPLAVERNLAAVIARATRVEPAERYPSMLEFDAELARVVDQKPVRELRGAWWVRIGLWRLRLAALARAHLWLTAGLLLLELVLVTAGALYLGRRVDDEQGAALREERTRQALGRFYADLFAEQPAGAASAEDRLTLMIRRGRYRLAHDPHYDDATRAALLHSLAQASLGAGRSEDCRALLDEAIALRRGLGAAAPLALAESLALAAQLAVVDGDVEHAAELNREATGLLADSAGQPRYDRFRALLQTSTSLDLAYSYADAQRYNDEALALGRGLYGADSVELLAARQVAHTILRDQFLVDRAQPFGEALLADLKRTYGPDDPIVETEATLLSRVQSLAGDYVPAEAHLRRMVERSTAAPGPNRAYREHAAHFDLGELVRMKGPVDDAKLHLDRALVLLEEFDPRHGTHWLNDSLYVVDFYQDIGDVEAARALRDRVVARIAELPRERLAPGIKTFLARVDARAGIADAASERELAAAETWYLGHYGEDSYFTGLLRASLANVRLLQGDREGARAVLARAATLKPHGMRYPYARLRSDLDNTRAALAEADGDAPGAIRIRREIVGMLVEQIGESHPLTAEMIVREADARRRAGLPYASDAVNRSIALITATQVSASPLRTLAVSLGGT